MKSGPKPKYGITKLTICLRLTPEALEHLRATGNISEAVERLVRKSAAFNRVKIAKRKK